jgi:hypothetical protein
MVETVRRCLCPCAAHPSLFVLVVGPGRRLGTPPERPPVGECVDPEVIMGVALLQPHGWAAAAHARWGAGPWAGGAHPAGARRQLSELWGAPEAPLLANPLLQLGRPAAQRTVEWHAHHPD